MRSQRATISGTNGTAPSTNDTNGHASEETTTAVVETQSQKMEVEASPAVITDERFAVFKSSLQKIFREARTASLAVARIKQTLNAEHSTPFTDGEIKAAIEKMEEENQVMVSDGIVFLI